MKLFRSFGKFIRDNFFNSKWKCVSCNKEIFDGEYFCEKCEKELPYNNGRICEHCGRKVLGFEKYCSTCKGILTHLDTCRSVFNYEKPISTLLKRAKYNNCVYLYDMFAEKMSFLFFTLFLKPDFLVYVPMTEKSFEKRGYNQSKVLAEKLSGLVGVPVLNVLSKVKDTVRQAKLNREQRMKNLTDAFKVTDKKTVKDKDIMIIDDVTTTGSTAEAIAERLKSAGASKVYLLTVASVPPIDKY